MKKTKRKHFLAAMLAAVTSLITGCGSAQSTDNIPAVSDFNLARYMGKWYEIARLPNSFEENITNAEADYVLLPDGTVEIINSGQRYGVTTSAIGLARPLGIGHTGALEVTFFRPFYGLYKVIYVNSEYNLAIVTGDTMDYVWILARKPVISAQELAMCLDKLKTWGFAVKLLQYPSGMVENLTISIPAASGKN